MENSNRIIKFRAWDKTNKVMYEVFDLMCGTENLMQFTGLLDKNGKEIYEGDIVRTNNFLGEVEFNKDTGCIEIITGKTTSELLWKTGFENKVIGNIYQDKDLIE